MKKFLKYLRKENIIENLIAYYKQNLKSNKEEEYLKKLIENIYNLDKLKDNRFKQKETISFNSKLDILGRIYEKSLNSKERKTLGEFYTPLFVVDYILNSVGYISFNNIDNKKLIDISCGSGTFIINAIKRLINRLSNRKSLNELSCEEAKTIILKIRENIYGIDINLIACILCQINIHLTLFELYILIKKRENDYYLPIFNIFNADALSLTYREKYDFIVGNPPYLFIRDIPKEQRQLIENSDFKTNVGQYDYYQIFIELGIKFLKNSGQLGYIVPDSLLALSNRSIIRKYIYNHTKIKEIYYIGPKFDDPVVSNIILILKKESDILRREKNIIRIRLLEQQEKHFIQKTLKKWDFKFLIHLKDIDISIIDHLNENFPKIKDLNKTKHFKISINRGVELSKTGEIIYCKRCELYFPVPKKDLFCPECKSQLKIEHIEKIIRDKIPEDKKENFKSFLYSINRYQIKINKYIDISKKGINYKKLSIYKDRIIIRQLSQSNLICATYQREFSLTSQSFYNLKIRLSPIKEFNHYYLLGLINSKLLSFYFIKSFGSYKKLFPRILIEKIKNFPIKIPETSTEKECALKIVDNVKFLLNSSETNDNSQKLIDSLIFNLYQISVKNMEYILNFMKNL